MKYLLLLFTVTTVAWGQDGVKAPDQLSELLKSLSDKVKDVSKSLNVSAPGDVNKITDQIGEMMRSLTDHVREATKSLPVDKTFGDLGNLLKPAKVSKRAADPQDTLSTMKAELKRKCYIYGSPKHYRNVEAAIETFDKCRSEVLYKIEQSGHENGDTRSHVATLCKYGSEAAGCFINYTDALQPCLPRYKGRNFPFSNITRAVVRYSCVADGAQDRLHSFMVSAENCFDSKRFELLQCMNNTFPKDSYPDIQKDSYVFSEENCSKMSELWGCVKAELLQCPQPAVPFLEGLFQTVGQFYTPCPLDRNNVTGNQVD